MTRKKTVTSWKSKKIYQVLAPENFDKKEVGETLADDASKLMGRTIKTSLGEIAGDRSKNYLNLIFEVDDVKGDKALTKFREFFIPIGYLRSKVRKKTKKLDYSRDITLDGLKARFELMVLSKYDMSESQKIQIKGVIAGIVDEQAKQGIDSMVSQSLYGKLGTEVYKAIKAVCPVTRVEVHHLQIL
jgi:small subunit ribosomal protein S3Ae